VHSPPLVEAKWRSHFEGVVELAGKPENDTFLSLSPSPSLERGIDEPQRATARKDAIF